MSARIGRPPVGPRVSLCLPSSMVATLDEVAQELGVSRAELIRRLLADGLADV